LTEDNILNIRMFSLRYRHNITKCLYSDLREMLRKELRLLVAQTLTTRMSKLAGWKPIEHAACVKLTWMTPVHTNQSIEVHITHPHTRTPATHLQSTFATLPDQTCEPLTKSNSGHFSVRLFSKTSVYRIPELKISTQYTENP
jgi:hypothetical protein